MDVGCLEAVSDRWRWKGPKDSVMGRGDVQLWHVHKRSWRLAVSETGVGF